MQRLDHTAKDLLDPGSSCQTIGVISLGDSAIEFRHCLNNYDQLCVVSSWRCPRSSLRSWTPRCDFRVNQRPRLCCSPGPKRVHGTTHLTFLLTLFKRATTCLLSGYRAQSSLFTLYLISNSSHRRCNEQMIVFLATEANVKLMCWIALLIVLSILLFPLFSFIS